ncbi:MAG: adenine phosphoribosyltransferase [Deltaproteobacteria bacterium]|nr:adenine phosphoribosyltransferase [Deltaproteobacteria bacterium]
MTDPRLDAVRALVRDIPDFPKPGILFKDITPLLANPVGFNHSLELLEERFEGERVDAIVGMEARGFIFGAALAARMRVSFVPARKPGKLPAEVERVEYALEYGTDSLEIHKDGLKKGDRVLVVDDLIATGGTAKATGDLIERMGAEVAAYAFVIDLTFLDGKAKLAPTRVEALLEY